MPVLYFALNSYLLSNAVTFPATSSIIVISCYGLMGVGPPAGWIEPDVMVTMRMNPK